MTRLSFDPQIFPVDSIAGEQALSADRLQAEWIRARFANPPLWVPENVESRGKLPLSQLQPAAVLMPIVLHESGPTLVFTLRTQGLRAHAGQISFPGGRVEDNDASLTETALRETEEEIGLGRQHVDVVGILPEYFTGTGYRVTPIVGLIAPPYNMQAHPGEVAEIFEVPLHYLMDGRHHQRRTVVLPSNDTHIVYSMPYEQFFIWGATAGMLRNLFHILRV